MQKQIRQRKIRIVKFDFELAQVKQGEVRA